MPANEVLPEGHPVTESTPGIVEQARRNREKRELREREAQQSRLNDAEFEDE